MQWKKEKKKKKEAEEERITRGVITSFSSSAYENSIGARKFVAGITRARSEMIRPRADKYMGNISR